MAIAIKAWKPCCMLANMVAVHEGFDTVQSENVWYVYWQNNKNSCCVASFVTGPAKKDQVGMQNLTTFFNFVTS